MAKQTDSKVGIYQCYGAWDDRSRPDLGIYRGTYVDVLTYVSKLPRWKCPWGGQSVGEIKELKIIDVDPTSVEKRRKLLEEKKSLEARLAEIDNAL